MARHPNWHIQMASGNSIMGKDGKKVPIGRKRSCRKVTPRIIISGYQVAMKTAITVFLPIIMMNPVY
jgi:hypothetical protein